MSRFGLARVSLALISYELAQAAILTPEQATQVRNISELTFSPDGAYLAGTVSNIPKGALPESHIWIFDGSRNEFRQFTFSTKSERSPQWSPDGKSLAFSSDRNERSQIYTIRVDGGEAMQLTSGKNAVGEFRWSPDGKQIAYLAPEPKSDADEKRETDKDDAKEADREKDLNRLWLLEVASKQGRQTTRGAWRISDFEWISPEHLMAVAADRPKMETWHNALYTIDVKTGAFTRFSQPNQPFGGLTVSKGRSEIAFAAANRAGPAPHDLFVQATQGGTARDVTAVLNRPVFGVKWQNDADAVISVGDGFRSVLYRIGRQDKPQPILLPYSTGDFDIAPNGVLAFIAQGFDRLPEVYVRSLQGKVRQISHVQPPAWTDIKLQTAEVFRFKSFDKAEIEGALMKPASAGKVQPLVVYVHGGPAGKFSESYSSWAQLLAANGFQVLMVNPRGSIGYGEEFLKANHANWGGGDFKDIVAGLDFVLARGEVDANRLGIGGWSYGGYMAEWAITQTDRFKAAVSGAGMFDLGAEFGTESGPEGDEWYFGTPWEHPELFARSSPMTYVSHAKTPTLILQGENDPIDPLGQSTALYRALKRYGVETELVTYPREPHGFKEEKHQIDVLIRMLEWFKRYLKPST